ncbi:MAG TPA: hypothetical protein VI874_01470 [Candidatus Norongarragalinales archaeon]|nr:hypothetical protein [Candidatus Norongarragalinales archaeon]
MEEIVKNSINQTSLKEILAWPLRNDLLDLELELVNEAYLVHRRQLKKIGIGLPALHFENTALYRVKKWVLENVA